MEEVFLKSKAFFIIFIIITSIIYFPINSQPASAQEIGCCEETILGDFCLDTTQNNCKPDKFRNSPCSETSFCSSIIDGGSLGCCFFPNSLDSCSNNVPESECISRNGQFLNSPDCSIFSQCIQGCCILSSQATLSTETQCNLQTQNLNLELDFRPEIANDIECANLANLEDEGCCILNGLYTYVTRAECSGEFNEGKFCSELSNSPCTSTETTKCIDGDVWKTDSCGNKDSQEEVCDYEEGVLCKDFETEARCISVNCEDTYEDDKNIHDPELGKFRDNGESWCIYEGPTGAYLDRPGSTHYRFSCVNGEEIVEPCRLFREEICVQNNPESASDNPLGGIQYNDLVSQLQNLPINQLNQLASYFDQLSPVLRTPMVFEPGDNFAECVNNDIYDKPLTQEQSTVPLGFAFWEFQGTPSTNSLISNSGIPNQFGISTALQEQRASIPRTDLPRTESSRDGSEICAQASLPPVKIKWEVGTSGFCKNKCIENCFAEEQKYIDDASEMCKSLGDCGVDYNIEGKLSPTRILSGIGSTIREASVGSSIGSLAGSVGGTLPGIAGSVAGGSVGGILGSGYPPSFIIKWEGNAPGPKPSSISSTKLAEWNKLGIFGGMKQVNLLSNDIRKQTLIRLGGTSGGKSNLNMVGAGVWGAGSATGAVLQAAGILPPVNPVFIIVDIVIVIVLLTVGNCDYPTKTVTISCNPWQPPSGGADCNLCNDLQDFSLVDVNGLSSNNCNEYKCKSLGKACQFIEAIEGGVCIEGDENDIKGPEIKPDNEKLDEQNLNIDETSNGYEILGELPAFEPITLAIKTDEPAICLHSNEITNSIDEMSSQFGHSLPAFEHSLTITHPPSSPETTTITDYFIRCKDTYDNPSNQYKITLTTKKAEDLQAPIIDSINVPNRFLEFQQSESEATLLVKDSSLVECKYSITENKQYDSMEGELFCTDTRPDDINYHCSALLTNLVEGENKFYFKCKDSSRGEFISTEKELTLIGSSQLTVSSTLPTPADTINSNDVTVAVVTTGGAEDGTAICSYSLNGRFVDKMRNTNARTHTQFQHLTEGNYRYDISCEDIAGNQAQTPIQFTVDLEGQTTPQIQPRLLHIFKETNLFIILNKQTNCEYSDQFFQYGDGFEMTELDSTVHSAPLGFSRYSIRCEDLSGNNISPIEIVP